MLLLRPVPRRAIFERPLLAEVPVMPKTEKIFTINSPISKNYAKAYPKRAEIFK